MSKLSKKHDQLTKKFLTDISVAKEFLIAHMAPDLLGKCILESLQIESGSYIEEDLAAHYSDLVYKLDLKENKGSAYIYCLLEHQSSAEKLMPFRILKYQLAIIQNHLDKHKGTTTLPIVSALVLYNGQKSPYPYHLDIANLFADLDAYKQAPLGIFRLIDLTVINDDKLLQHGKLAVLEILIKHINERNFNNIISIIITALRVGLNSGISSSLLNSTFSYLMNAKETEEIKQLLKRIELDIPEVKDNIMTYAEELIQKGKLEGIMEGKREGKLEGIMEGKLESQLEIAKSLLKSGIDEVIVAAATNLSLDQLRTLN